MCVLPQKTFIHSHLLQSQLPFSTGLLHGQEMQAQVAREVDKPGFTWLPPSGGPRQGMMQHSYPRPGITRQSAALLHLCAELTYLKTCGSERAEPPSDAEGLPPPVGFNMTEMQLTDEFA